MKTNSINKIENFFNHIKSEAIYEALKNKNYKGIKRDQIEHMLKTKSIDEVYKILKIKYKKNNLLLIYFLLFFLSLIIVLFTSGYQFYKTRVFDFQKFFNLENYDSFFIIDYIFIASTSFTILFLLLIFYEAIMKLRFKL